jgi:N-acetylmuramidase
MGFFKDDPALADAPLAPAKRFTRLPGAGTLPGRLARIHNRIGGLMQAFAQGAGIPVAASLAVWAVESGGLAFIPDRPVLRFEIHKFWIHWGEAHADVFDAHFQFGGRGGIEGKPWLKHRFRMAAVDDWAGFHGDQDAEYRVFAFAAALGGREAACLSASFGGPQILGSNFGIIGYQSAAALFDAFAQAERWQVCGFFDYCRHHGLIGAITSQDWLAFARAYNGDGQAADYARLTGDAHQAALALGGLPMGRRAGAADAPVPFNSRR